MENIQNKDGKIAKLSLGVKEKILYLFDKFIYKLKLFYYDY
jgi:hypothetical protein